MGKINRKDINKIIAEAILGEGKKDKKNQQQTVGSQEETIKAYNKASRDAEKEEHGGVLAFQHNSYTKNKKDVVSKKDKFSRNCKHKGGRRDIDDCDSMPTAGSITDNMDEGIEFILTIDD